MAKKTKSSFAGRINEAHESHKDDDTKVGAGGDLPPGIEHGIARLVDARIGVFQKGDNEGEPFFMAAGTVLEPDSVEVTDPKTKKSRIIPIKGLRTQVGPIPICDTKTQAGKETSLADHWDRILNHLRLLGIDTKETEPDEIVSEPSEGVYETGSILEALQEAAPAFRFRTWQGKPSKEWPDPRINHEWRGACEYDGEATDEVQDDTEAPWESDEKKDEAEPEPEPEVAEEVESAAQDVDFLALGKLADGGKPKAKAEEAARTLTGHAKVLGVDGYEDMETWAEVAEAIVAHEEAEGEGEEVEEEEYSEEEPEEWAPEAGEQCFFKPPRAKKAVQCEVVKVSAKLEKADVKRSDTNKITKGVPFAKLAASEDDF
jgi:hypothetical protein